MAAEMKTAFSIEHLICEETGQQFGEKYRGVFSIRRPSLLDKRNIALLDAAGMSAYGQTAPGTVEPGLELINYIFAYVQTVAEDDLPAWFNMATMYTEEDEAAVLAVWKEVGKFRDTFRPKAAGSDSGSGSAEGTMVVSEEIPATPDRPAVP